MPPIFKTITNAMQGKPLFDPNQTPQSPQQQPIPPLDDPIMLPNGQPLQQAQTQPQQPPQPQAETHEPTINRNDSRTYPTVRIRHTATRLFNGQMEIRSRIINESPYEVDVHKVEMLGTITDIRYPLNSGQDKEFLIYRGPCMQNDSHRTMAVEYKAENGEYFTSTHDIRYQINADRSFSVSDLILHPPVRLIAG